jgi:hypothetical protein
MTGAVRPSVVFIRQQRVRAADVAALIMRVCLEHEQELETKTLRNVAFSKWALGEREYGCYRCSDRFGRAI